MPTLLKRHHAAMTLAGALVLSLSACVGTPNAVPPEPRKEDSFAPVPEMARQAVSIVVAFALGNKALPTIKKRVASRAQQCMKTEGFQFQDPSKDTVFGIQGNTVTEYLAYAHSEGYGVSSAARNSLSNSITEDPNLNFVGSLPASERTRYWRTLTGFPVQPTIDSVELPQFAAPAPESGCLPQAIWFEIHDLPFFDPKIGPVIRQFRAREFSDGLLQDASKNWVKCMRTYGYSYTKYDDAADEYIDRVSTMYLKDQIAGAKAERALASRDAECYVDTMHEAYRQHETAFLRELSDNYSQTAARIRTILQDW